MNRVHQGGMALGLVLLLMVGLAMLALAGYSAAIAALAVAGFSQHAARTVEAAEAGVSRALRSWQVAGAAGSPVVEPAWPETWPDITIERSVSADPPGHPAAWPDGFSVGDGAYTTRHYTIVAGARGARRTAARIEQGFIVIEPAP